MAVEETEVVPAVDSCVVESVIDFDDSSKEDGGLDKDFGSDSCRHCFR